MDIVDESCSSTEPTDGNGTIPADERPVIISITVTAMETARKMRNRYLTKAPQK